MDQWIPFQYKISQTNGPYLSLTFKARRGKSPQGDFAIDDITWFRGECTDRPMFRGCREYVLLYYNKICKVFFQNASLLIFFLNFFKAFSPNFLKTNAKSNVWRSCHWLLELYGRKYARIGLQPNLYVGSHGNTHLQYYHPLRRHVAVINNSILLNIFVLKN